MSEQTTTEQITDAAEGTEPQATGAEPGNQTEAQAEPGKTFTQADVDRIVKERLTREQAKAEAKANEAARKAEQAALAEQGKYKDLWEKAEADKANAAAELAKLQRQQLATSIAAKVGLPAGLAARLQGTTEDEIEADAKALLADLPKPAAPNLNSSPGSNAPVAGQMTDAEKRELAARYGVNPRYIN